MQPGCRVAPARPLAPCQARATTTSSRGSALRVAPARRLPLCARAASCGGGATEPVPVEAREDGEAAGQRAPEELEVLEEEAIAGEDEGRRPTDYDRRAHIFEESSRVFRELKHRRDGDGEGDDGGESGSGGVTGGATATETATREQQEQLG